MKTRSLIGLVAALVITVFESAAFNGVLARADFGDAPAVLNAVANDETQAPNLEIVVTASRLPPL